MAKRIKKINVTSDKKGTVKNPYTVEEHEQMLAEGQWTEDGFVEELGLVEVIVNVIGTYNSGIGLTNVGTSRTVYSQNR